MRRALKIISPRRIITARVGNGRHSGADLAEDFGLERKGPVTKDDFGKIADNINPVTGKRLTLRTNEHRRIGEE